MITAKRFTLLMAAVIVAIASGCKNPSSPVSQSSPAPVESAAPPASAPAKDDAEPSPSKGEDASEPKPANGSTPSEATVNCDNAQTQADMNICAQQGYEAADRQLNQTYQQLRNSLSSAERQELQSAEQAWIEFRDSNCEFESSQYEGGSMQPSVYYGCLEQLTNDRTNELQRQLESPS